MKPFGSMTLKFNLRPRWFSFARLFVFNRLFWYVAFSASLMMCLRNRYLKRIVPFILIVQLGYIMLSRTTYNDSIYSLAANTIPSLKKDHLTWKEFYDEALFTKIKKDINYKGEPVAAVGYHEMILMYNGLIVSVDIFPAIPIKIC